MNKYIFDTNGKIKKDTTISLFSDFHVSKDSNEKKLTNVIDFLEKIAPNYIFLLGDIIQDTNMSYTLMTKLYKYLSTMGEIAKIYMIYGNHDLQTRKQGKWVKYENEDYYSMLNDVDNLTVLDNETITLDENIAITGIKLPYKYYNVAYEDNKLYLELLNEYIKRNLLGKLNNETYNIFLQHTPNNIIDKETYLEILKNIKEKLNRDINFDLIISGHLHNGLVPSYIDRIVPGSRGIIGLTGSKIVPFKNNCRGSKEITDTTTSIILPAVSTLEEHKFLNKFYPPTNKTLVLKK